jgi:hypothetical protein
MKLNSVQGQTKLYDALGVPKERMDELNGHAEEVWKSRLETVSEDLQALAVFCNSPEELAIMCYQLGIYIGRRETFGWLS